jgi:exodeoxyribonuclease-3
MDAMTIKLISWNVNGLRAAIKSGLSGFIQKESPDIMAMQEVKISEGQVPLELSSGGYTAYLNPAEKKGYSGTLTLSKIDPISLIRGIGNPEFDTEGRIMGLELDNFYFLNVYFPNSQRGLTRLDYKLAFNSEFHRFCNKLREKKPVVITGDFNVAHREIDIANPRSNEHNAGFTKEERDWMTEFLEDGYVDTFRMFNGDPGHYSWWSYMHNARSRNIGWRIDYFVVSADMKSRVKDAGIMEEVTGSDYAPVYLVLDY